MCGIAKAGKWLDVAVVVVDEGAGYIASFSGIYNSAILLLYFSQ